MGGTDGKSLAEQAVVVILAAGQGKRMGREDMAKVCFEIDGTPAIVRIMETFKRQRFHKFMLVVGSHAEQVMAAASSVHPETCYVFQSPQLGTGHAGRMAAETLQSMGHTGPVLLSLGDKFLEGEAITALVGGHIRRRADASLLTVPRTPAMATSSGRVYIDQDGQAQGIIEAVDLGRQAAADELAALVKKAAPITAAKLNAVIAKHLPSEKKRARAVGELLALAGKSGPVSKQRLAALLADEKFHLKVAGREISAAQIDRTCTQFNPSLYLFNADAFYWGSAQIDNNNAQQEYYFTDIVSHLGNANDDQGQARFRVRTVPSDDPDVIQGFNSPDELLAIQDYVRRRKDRSSADRAGGCRLPASQFRSVRQWLEKLQAPKPKLKTWLRKIYGQHDQLHEQKIKDMIKLLRCHGKRFGYDEKVVIVRAPGRINLMGRHVDHRGAFNNFLALHRETIAVAGLRSDDRVVAVNTDPKRYKPVDFSISELIGRFAFSDWINFVNSDWVRELLRSSAGDWGNYIRAAMLRLQHQYADLKIGGLNLALTGDVPIAAGLSSSSTIVVATLQAAIALNGLDLTSQQVVDLCGEGEWFVGSRGGSGDHAAITLGQRGRIAQVGYLPFQVGRVIDAPKDYQVLIANSHIKAAKSSHAKDAFNSRIVSYNLGLALLRQRCPEIAATVEYVRDLTPEKLGCRTSELYRYLLRVPERMTRKDFRAVLSKEHRDLLDVNFSSHAEPEYYEVRGVLMFGAAETVRSRMCADLLEREDVGAFGELMQISHDGDRVSRAEAGGKRHAWNADYSDAAIERLIVDLGSEDPQKVLAAQLFMQPGAYACSTTEIDTMVDITCGIDGVAGAQIAGAGLGGCIMILAHHDVVPTVRRALIKQYYHPHKLKPAVIECTTVEGAGLAQF